MSVFSEIAKLVDEKAFFRCKNCGGVLVRKAFGIMECATCGAPHYPVGGEKK